MKHKESIMKLWQRALVFAALGIWAAQSGAQDASAYKIIVNPSNPATQLSRLKVGEML